MMVKKIILLSMIYVFCTGCVDDSKSIQMQLFQDVGASIDDRLNFVLTLSSNSEASISLDVHQDINEKLMMNTVKNFNMCETLPFYLNRRDSNITEILISKSNPYVMRVTADYSFNQNKNMHIYDFGNLGKICIDRLSNSFVLAFTFYEADIHSLSNIFYDKTDGIPSNRVEVEVVPKKTNK